jgi:hypothetical protein
MYLGRMTRPDLSYGIKELTRKFNNPSTVDMRAAQRLLLYAKGTQHRKLTYRRNIMQQLRQPNVSPWTAYVDSGHADQDDLRSTGGFVIFYLGCAVSYSSKTQPLTRLSSTGSELGGLVNLLIKLKWITGMGQEFRLPGSSLPVRTYIDNAGLVKNVASDKVGTRMRHNAIKLNFIRDLRDLGLYTAIWVCTADEIADVFTKKLALPLFERFADLICDGKDALVLLLKGGAKTTFNNEA